MLFMIVAIAGAGEMPGSRIAAEMENRGHQVLLLDREEPDITELSRVKEFCRRERPEVIINCAACTGAEAAKEGSGRELQPMGSRNLALACNEWDIDLVYISTHEGYNRPALQNKHGYSKMLAEKIIAALANNYYIIRAGADNTADAAHLARLVGDLIRTRRYGIYHLVNQQLKMVSRAAERKSIDSHKEYLSIIERHKSMINAALPDQCPLVSIIIVNRNGSHHLRGLFKAISENTIYPHYEIIVVDNASEDDSMEFLQSNRFKLPIKIINNENNETFSRANNRAAEMAGGDFLLFLNNDTEPLYGWLNELMKSALGNLSNLGGIGAKLIYPHKKEASLSYTIQHAGIAFKGERGFIRPYNMGRGLDPFNKIFSEIAERGALTAAALLIARERFFEVGGFDERFNYGYEDVDLSLKLYAKGYKNIYCPTAVLFHYESATQDQETRQVMMGRLMKNMDLLQRIWYPWLKKQLFFDKMDSRRVLSENTLKVAIAFTGADADDAAGSSFRASDLGGALKEIGWEVIYLAGKGGGDWYAFADDVDVLISLSEDYDLSKIRTVSAFLIKIAWLRHCSAGGVGQKHFSQYDIIFAESRLICQYVKSNFHREAVLLPAAMDPRIIKDALRAFLYDGDGNYQEWRDNHLT